MIAMDGYISNCAAHTALASSVSNTHRVSLETLESR